MKNGLILLIAIIFIFVMSWLIGDKLQSYQEMPFQDMIVSSCQPVDAQCKAEFSDATLQFELSSPVVMMPFVAKVITHADVSDIYLHFRMKNMEMGVQRYRLVNDGNGLWQSEAVLPVCSLGRSDWIATLEVKYKGAWWRGDFEFKVVGNL